MTTQSHLAKAKDYIAKGENYYRKAAEEMQAAKDEGATWVEIADALGRSVDWVTKIVAWHKTPANEPYPDTPFARVEDDPRDRSAARKVLRESSAEEIAEQFLGDPQVRAKVSRALDEHYTERATQSTQRRRDREVERKGGEEALADHERRQRLAEMLDVARGAASGLRFVANQAKGLELDGDDSGAVEELTGLLDEVAGFVSMLRDYLGGQSISDEDIAALIGEDR